LIDDRGPHSDAFRFRGKEWFEDAVCQVWRDSWYLEPELKHHLGSLSTGLQFRA
jgi:hypothetical protein